MGNPELSYIGNIDRAKQGSNTNYRDAGKDVGAEAEKVVMEFFKKHFNGAEIRPATKEEDRGPTGLDSGKIIDAVLYMDNRPAAGLQITTATDSAVRFKKMEELKNKPILRLDEMARTDVAIPRILANLKAAEVAGFEADKDFAKHPKIGQDVLDSSINSLRYCLTQTKNPAEQKHISWLIKTFEEKQEELYGKKSGKPN